MRGIQRYGSFYLPMDEALVLCAVDLSGRCTLNWDVHCKTEKVGDFDVECASEFWLGFARNVPATAPLCTICRGKIPTTFSKPASRGQAARWLRQSLLMPPTGTRSPPRKDCWYDRDHRLRRGQSVQPALQPDASGAEGCCDRRCTDHAARPTGSSCRGSGAFGDAMDKLSATGLVPVIREQAAQKPLLGICLGMQLLFEKSYEYGEHEGLGFVKGEVCPLEPDLKDKTLKVPQIGWNALHIVRDDPLFRYIREGEYVYYVHSYYGKNLYREYTCCQRLLHPRDRRGQGGQGVRYPVPPRKKRETGLADR